MQTIRKKSRPAKANTRIRWLIAAVVLLVLIAAIPPLLNRDIPVEDTAITESDQILLYEYGYTSVDSITIRRGNEEPWTAVYSGGENPGEEAVTILGYDGFTLNWDESISFLLGAVCIAAEDVLTDDPAVYADHLDDYGLASPKYEARIQYTDGTDITLRVGNKGPEGTWRYMLVSGDDRLFAFSNGSVEALFVNKDTLRKVSQPVLHKARIDRIALTWPDGMKAQWTLAGKITDADAADKWRITAPFSYPADSTAMQPLLANIADIHLGAYVCVATPEALTAYGFDAPRLTIDIHMAEGTIATTNAEGAAEATDWPEASLTFVIGGEKSDMIDYVLWDGQIYISSHFTLGVFLDYDVTTTMSRYPVMTALGNLASLTIQQGAEITAYQLTRTEKVAENNELITDEDGHPIYDVTVTQNGMPVDYSAFEAAYNALSLVTVSGTLPPGETVEGVPHTVYTFTDVDGTVHTVALTTFDVLHDAVSVDGYQAFYLIKGGFELKMK